jgi:hypothetical protein
VRVVRSLAVVACLFAGTLVVEGLVRLGGVDAGLFVLGAWGFAPLVLVVVAILVGGGRIAVIRAMSLAAVAVAYGVFYAVLARDLSSSTGSLFTLALPLYAFSVVAALVALFWLAGVLAEFVRSPSHPAR